MTQREKDDPHESGKDGNVQYHLWIVYLLVTLYALCYQLQQPIEPFLVERLVASSPTSDSDQPRHDAALSYGRLQSFFSVVQTLGSLVIGYLLDRWGLRVGFLINFVACALSYYLLSITTTLRGLYLSKLPGVAMAGFLCAQATVSRLMARAPAADRVVALGRLTTSYTIGGIVGPYLGGLAGAAKDYFWGAKLATLGSILCAALVFLLPPLSTTTHQQDGAATPDATSDGQQDAEGVEMTTKLLQETTTRKEETTRTKIGATKPPITTSFVERPETSSSSSSSSWFSRASVVIARVGTLLCLKGLSALGNSMTGSARPLILKNEMGFTEAQLGLYLSSQFAFGGFANGVLLRPMNQWLGGQLPLVISNCLVALSFGNFGQALAFSVLSTTTTTTTTTVLWNTVLYIGIAMTLVIFQFLLTTSITAETTALVPSHSRGTLLGMEHALFAVAHILGPIWGIGALEQAGMVGVALACGLVFGAICLFWKWRQKINTGAGAGAAGVEPEKWDPEEKEMDAETDDTTTTNRQSSLSLSSSSSTTTGTTKTPLSNAGGGEKKTD